MKDLEFIENLSKNISFRDIIRSSYLEDLKNSIMYYNLDLNLDDPLLDVDYEDYHYNMLSYLNVVNTFEYIKQVNINSEDLNLFKKVKDNITYDVYGIDRLIKIYVIYNKNGIIDYWEPIKEDDLFLEYLKDKDTFRKKYKPIIPSVIKELYN